MNSTRWLTRTCGAGALLATLFVVGVADASPAAADGAGPTRFESVIDDVRPDLDEVEVSIVGGDAFIQVEADEGTEVAIDGYDGEPYLRIEADGTVQQNVRSPSVYLNLTRGGSEGRFPDGVSSGAEPEWETIGRGGIVSWHDHRIHWMPEQDPTVGADGLVQAWALPLDVDGTRVEVTGRLLLRESVFPWAAIVAVVAAGAAFVLGRTARLRLAVLGVASLAAVATAVAAFTINPPRSGASVIPVALPVIAVVAVAAGWWSTSTGRRGIWQLAFPLAAVAALFGWVVQRLGVFWMATVPTAMPVWLDRALTGVALGAAVGTAVAVLIRPITDQSTPADPAGPDRRGPDVVGPDAVGPDAVGPDAVGPDQGSPVSGAPDGGAQEPAQDSSTGRSPSVQS